MSNADEPLNDAFKRLERSLGRMDAKLGAITSKLNNAPGHSAYLCFFVVIAAAPLIGLAFALWGN